MKKLFVLALGLMLSSAAFGKVVVGTVDIQRILVSVKEGKSVKSKLEASFKKKQKILRSDETKFKKKTEDFQKQRLVLNDKKRMEKEKSLQKELYGLEKKRAQFQQEIQAMEAKLKKPILNKVMAIIKTVSKGAKVDVTFEKSTAPVVYAANQVDITEKVIAAYDKKHK